MASGHVWAQSKLTATQGENVFMNNLRASFTDGLGIATANILTFLPKLLIFVAIVVGGYFLAKFLARMFDKLLERLRFDNLVERGGVKRVLQKANCDASDVMAKLLFYGLFLFVLQFAFGIFGPNPISNLLTQIIAYIPNILVAAIIIIVAAAVGKGISDILNISLGGLSYGRVLAKASGVRCGDRGHWCICGTQPTRDCARDCERSFLRDARHHCRFVRHCDRRRRHQTDAASVGTRH
jgi:hypothetical protein